LTETPNRPQESDPKVGHNKLSEHQGHKSTKISSESEIGRSKLNPRRGSKARMDSNDQDVSISPDDELGGEERPSHPQGGDIHHISMGIVNKPFPSGRGGKNSPPRPQVAASGPNPSSFGNSPPRSRLF